MQKMLTIGLMLLSAFSCSQAVIKEPQPFFVVNTHLLSVASGKKSFNYKLGDATMGEWVVDPVLVEWSSLPKNLACFPLETWLVKIKPVLKDVARQRRDRND